MTRSTRRSKQRSSTDVIAALHAPEPSPSYATHTHVRRYVPSGMDPAAYAALKKEAAASKKSDRKAYKSRSVQK